MFKSSERLRHEAAQRSLDRVASTWRSSRTTWFDGTPESIDMRLAATDRVLTVARSGFTPAHLELTVEAENARRELMAAKHQLLTDFLDDSARAFKGSKRVAAVDPLDPESDEYTSDTGWQTFNLPGDSFDDKHDWLMKQLGRSPEEAQEARDAHHRWTGKEGSRRVAGSRYFNDEGEPLMSGAQARFEDYLDADPDLHDSHYGDDFGPDYDDDDDDDDEGTIYGQHPNDYQADKEWMDFRAGSLREAKERGLLPVSDFARRTATKLHVAAERLPRCPGCNNYLDYREALEGGCDDCSGNRPMDWDARKAVMDFAQSVGKSGWNHQRKLDMRDTAWRLRPKKAKVDDPVGKHRAEAAKERGLRECINCGGSLSGEEDDDKDSECGHCGESAHYPRGERKSHIHEARGYQENEDWEEGGHYGDYNGKCPHCKSDNIDAGGYHGSGEYDCYDCGKTFHPKVRKFKSNVHTAGYYDYENDADGGWDRYVEQRLAPKSVGEETTVDGHPVHTFSSTGQAYNDTQTNENIKTGDILHIPSEGVVGMADTWPVAVTKNSGQLHAYGPDVHTDPSVLDTEEFQKYRGPNSDHFRRALQFAQQNGYETGPHEGQ